MAFVNCQRLSAEVWEFYCNSCGKVLDREGKEYVEYVLRTGDRPYCFDCDNVGLTESPAIFKDYWLYTWFITSPEREFTEVIEFAESTGTIEAMYTITDRDKLVEMKNLGRPMGSTACLVVHKSRERREKNVPK